MNSADSKIVAVLRSGNRLDGVADFLSRSCQRLVISEMIGHFSESLSRGDRKRGRRCDLLIMGLYRFARGKNCFTNYFQDQGHVDEMRRRALIGSHAFEEAEGL